MPTEHKVLSYKFDELTDRAKEKARDLCRESVLDWEWWEATYEDASRVGIKITGFDLGRGQSLDAKFERDLVDIARAIVKEHGKTCDTYAVSEAFLDALAKNGEPTEEQAEDFKRDIKRAYWDALQGEAEYLTGDEAIDEFIHANEWDFTENGRRFSF